MILRAEPRVIPTLGCLLHLSFQEDGYTASELEVEEALYDTELAVAEGTGDLWYAVDPCRGGLPVGMIELRHLSLPPIGRHTLIARFVVDQKYRMRGIGRRLIAASLASLPDETVLLSMRWGKEIPRSFKKLGAVPVGIVMAGRAKDVKGRITRGR